MRLQSRQISQLHVYQVLHAVRLARKPMSRGEIGEATGLSQPAVSTLTRRLLDSGALIEAGARPSSGGGRRERELAIHAEFACVVGIKVSMHQVTVALTDFAGGVRETRKLEIAAPLAPAALVRLLARAVDECLAGAGEAVRARLAGVGVAVPGFVDSLRDEVSWSPVLKPARNGQPAQLGASLEERVHVPVFVENDANMLALAEQWFGPGADRSNLAVITLEHGLGLGLVINGELYRGHTGLAAELGHVQIDPAGRACRCGKRGCLEAYVAHYALVRQAQEAGLLPGVLPAGDELPAQAVESAYFALAQRAAASPAGSPLRQLYERQGRLLGQWIGNVMTLIAPQGVILDGGPPEAAGLYEPALRQALEQAATLPHRQAAPLTIEHHGDAVWARGAASLVLQRLDESAEILESATRHGLAITSPGRRPRP